MSTPASAASVKSVGSAGSPDRGQHDRFAAARAARQRKMMANGGHKPSDSSKTFAHYANHSSHPNAPFRNVMLQADARIAEALARVDALPEEAFRFGEPRTIVEHRATGERREYGESPIGKAVMS